MSSDEVRVVVVDDDIDTSEAVKGVLELDGYQVRTAGDAQQALAVIADYRPACVILDLLLPDVSGIELARQIRGRYGTDLVLIVLTGSTLPEHQRAAEEAGVDFVLFKPLDLSTLHRMLPKL